MDRQSRLLPALMTQIFGLVILLLLPFDGVRAEGSWQMGLFEGLSYRQPLYETNANANRSVLRVDILNPGEVINVLACGSNNNSNIRVLMYDPFGALVYNTTAGPNVDCEDPFTSTFNPAAVNAHQHVTNTTGVYEIHLANLNGTFLRRFDVTVTNNVNDAIDPQENGGRLWSDYWYFWAGSFAQSASTDADLYVVADGGFTGTYFVWKLDLNNFAGYGYGLKGNKLGVVSPNAAGDVVAGMSVPSAGNSIVEEFPIYLSYPEKNYPEPTQTFSVSELEFIDEDNTDNAITSGGSGTFSFTTDFTGEAVYEIIIDTGSPTGGGPDGVYGQGDVFLRSNAVPGVNSTQWDGTDNNGDPVPLGAYTAELNVRTGEYHFVADDVETSGGPNDRGLKIYRAQPNGIDLPTRIYWDDLTVLNSPAPDAFNHTGIYDGDHNWGAFNSGGVGNVALIDTYTYGLSVSPNPIGVAIVPDNSALATITKSFTPNTIPYGGISNMQFEITNTGTTTLTGITVSDAMPLGMTLVTDPASISVTGTGCSGFSYSSNTVVGGDQLNIVDGTIAPGSTCTVAADVTAVQPGELLNTTSGVTANQLPFGVISNTASLFVLPEVSGTPFVCDAHFYESETVGSSTRLLNVNTSALPFARTEFTGVSYAPSNDYRYTGLAYGPQDNYLYGIVTESNSALGVPATGSIVRIDSDGKVVDLGVPQTGPNTMGMPVVSDRFVGGTFTADGTYIVVTDASPVAYSGANIPVGERGLILEIDVSVNPPQVLYNRPHGQDVGDIVAHPNGNLYSHTAGAGLITIDNQTGSVTNIGGNIADRVSGLTSDNWGTVYAHTENTAQLYQVDVNTGIGTNVSVLPGGATTDGASCSNGVAIRKTVTAIAVEPGNAVTYALSVVNGGNTTQTIDISDNLQDARTFVAGSLVNPVGGTPNNYGDTNLLTISGVTLAPNSTETIQFDVMYPLGMAEGISENQATVQYNGVQVVSDYPVTAGIGDPTPIEVLPGPGIGISKRAEVSGNEVTYWFTIENTGFGELQALSLADDLDAVFGAGNYAVTVPPALVVDPGTVVLTNNFTGTGAGIAIIDAGSNSTLQEGAQAVVRVTVTVNNLTDVGAGFAVYSNQVTVNAGSPGGNALTDLSVDGDNVDPDGNGSPDEQSPTVVNLSSALTVSGKVFEDNGQGAIPHDGVFGGSEQPIAGAVVELRDSSGNLVDTAITASDGTYSITVPDNLAGNSLQLVLLPVQAFLSVSENYISNGAANKTDGAVTFIANINTATTLIDFGLVKTPQWVNDNVAENSPDTVVFHPHRFRAHSSGELDLTFASQTGQPNNPDFSAVLYRDFNCDGALDSGDTAISAAIAVTANTEVCVVNKVYIPGNVANDDTFTTTVDATLTYSDAASTSHGLTSVLQVTDITRAIASGEGVLVLDKTVQNITTAGAVTTRNTAIPDDVLRYTIDFRNSGTGPVTEVLITDTTPAFSVLEQSVQCPAVMPDGIVNCQVLMPAPANNVPGYNGPVHWQFDGPLSAGAQGLVSFEIRVE